MASPAQIAANRRNALNSTGPRTARGKAIAIWKLCRCERVEKEICEQEIYEDLCRQLKMRDRHTGVLRRNAITRRIDLNTLVGRRLSVQDIQLEGMAECGPCYWMNTSFGPRAEDALRQPAELPASSARFASSLCFAVG